MCWDYSNEDGSCRTSKSIKALRWTTQSHANSSRFSEVEYASTSIGDRLDFIQASIRSKLFDKICQGEARIWAGKSSRNELQHPSGIGLLPHASGRSLKRYQLKLSCPTPAAFMVGLDSMAAWSSADDCQDISPPRDLNPGGLPQLPSHTP